MTLRVTTTVLAFLAICASPLLLAVTVAPISSILWPVSMVTPVIVVLLFAMTLTIVELSTFELFTVELSIMAPLSTSEVAPVTLLYLTTLPPATVAPSVTFPCVIVLPPSTMVSFPETVELCRIDASTVAFDDTFELTSTAPPVALPPSVR